MFVPILKFIGKFIWRLSAISNPFSLVGLSVGAISSFSWAQVARADAPLLPDRSLGKPSAHLLNTPPILPDYSWENFTTLSLHLPTELEEVEFPARNPSPLVTPENQETGNIYELEESERFSADTIRVTQFEFEGNTVFDREELEEVIKKALSLEELPANLTFSQLLQARSAVTQHYIDQGYITSGAYIPEQDFDTQSGIIKIRVVEGKVTVNVTTDSSSNTLGKRCLEKQLDISSPLNQERLLETLQHLLNLNPRIEHLNAELKSGLSPGTNQLDITVREAELKPSWSASLLVNNNQSTSIGSLERQIQLHAENLVNSGGDIWNFTYSNSDASNAFDIDVTLQDWPEDDNCTHHALNLKTGFRSSAIIEPDFQRLDINSASRYAEVTFSGENVITPGQNLLWSVTGSWRELETSVLGFRFPISLDADDAGEAQAIAIRGAGEWRHRSSNQVWMLRSELSLGSNTAPKKGFVVFRGQAQWVRRLAPDTLFFLNGTIQLSPSRLPAFEQIGIGGQATVRGYRKNFLLTDSGALLSAELQLPILRIPAWDSTVWLNPFVDVGMGWNTFNVSPDSNFLWSTGLGLQWKVGDRLTARLDWGIPLVSVPSRGNSLQENSLSFSLVWKVVNSGF